MNEPYFKPWIGKEYEANRVLILSESTYDWMDEKGETVTPDSFQAQGSVGCAIAHEHAFGCQRLERQGNTNYYCRAHP